MDATKNTNHFGKYLSELRISRGYLNTNEYLRAYPIAMSSVHYRHLESGSRRVSIEAAKELCEALKVDAKVFYFHLLKDSLPEEFMDFFVAMAKETSYDSPVEKNEINQQYQQAVMRTLSSRVHFPTIEACDYLEKHFELMPLIWFVYSTHSASLEEIQAIAQKNEITVPLEKHLDELAALGLILVKKDSNKFIVSRVKPTISFSHHRLGLQILSHETNLSLSQYNKARNPELKEPILILSIMSVSEKTRKIIFRRIQDFVSESRAAAEISYNSTEKSEPVFYSVVFAPQRQYSVKPVSEKPVSDT